MISMPAGFPAAQGALNAPGGSTRTGLAMLDGTDGAARLVFTGRGTRRRTAALDEWLAIIRVQPPLGRGVQLLWVLDARSTRWSGGPPPDGLLGPATDPVLWFRAGGAAV